MRRSGREKERVANEVQEALSASANPMLPMPHDLDRIGHGVKLSEKEWQNWIQRQTAHREKYLDYDKIFARPSEETASKIWELLTELGFCDMKWPAAYHTFISEADQESRKFAAKQGLIIVLDAFLSAGASHRQITYREVFDALCHGFSDHFVTMRGKVDSVRDMRPSTVARCRRDLRLAGVAPKDLWSAVMKWSKKQNPLFRVKEHNTGNRTIIRVQLPVAGDSARQRYKEIDGPTERYVPAPPWGITVKFASEELEEPKDKVSKMCAEHPYNVVYLGERSKEVLRCQSAVTLYFDVPAFISDYEQARDDVSSAQARLEKDYHIDASLSHTTRILRTKTQTGDRVQQKWSRRSEHVYYRSIELGIREGKTQSLTPGDLRTYEKLASCQRHLEKLKRWLKPSEGLLAGRQEPFEWLCSASRQQTLNWLDQIEESFEHDPTMTPEMAYLQVDKAMRGWRDEVRCLFEQYDTARRHGQVFQRVYERVADDGKGLEEIHSAFRRLVNRRYQPFHFWPTYVTSKDRSQLRDNEDVEIEASAENKLESYRSRWFKGKDPDTGKPCNLAGFDISSSQMQIIAVFMGDEDLEKLTMTSPGEPSFKETMANWAWKMHTANDLELRRGSVDIPAYSGDGDERLQELVKELLMRVSYGSNWKTDEMDQRLHPKQYGPGWETGSAGKFIRSFNKRYPGPSRFREICIGAARISYASDKYQGLAFIDPFDSAVVRWNPVARDDSYPVGSDGDGLRISVPRGLLRRAQLKLSQQDADDGCNDLANKTSPNIGDYEVDAHELEKLAAPCLVHFLDAYYSSLVMKELVSEGIECFVGIHDCWLVPESRIDVLEKAMHKAARAWYFGLGPMYERLLLYLEKDGNKSKDREPQESRKQVTTYDAVCDAFSKWNKRISGKWWPRFRAKSVGRRLGEARS
jgi:hypothetical protein